MSTISAAHTLRQCGYRVTLLPVRTGRPKRVWSVGSGGGWGHHTLAAGVRLSDSELVTLAASLA